MFAVGLVLCLIIASEINTVAYSDCTMSLVFTIGQLYNYIPIPKEIIIKAVATVINRFRILSIMLSSVAYATISFLVEISFNL